MHFRHTPAMLVEAIEYLNCSPGKIYVDGTLGGCGHAAVICEKMAPDGFLIGIDQDVDAIENAKKILEPYRENVRLFHGNFTHLPEFLTQLDIPAVDGILLDLGLSQHQLESSGRGFSFKRDEPLDMRMNIASRKTASDIINTSREKDLKQIFREYGEERWSGRIARKIVSVRKEKPIESSLALARIVSSAIPLNAGKSRRKIHPATRIFMALRIAVNQELERLDRFMRRVADYLNPEGRLCVLSFHSLEDRIVKHRIKALEKGCTCPPEFPQCVCKKKSVFRSLTKKVLRPTAEECMRNPMARSTKLRAAERL